MDISDFEYKLLSEIGQSEYGITRKMLESDFGEQTGTALRQLRSKRLIRSAYPPAEEKKWEEYTMDDAGKMSGPKTLPVANYYLTDEGMLAVQSMEYRQGLDAEEKKVRFKRDLLISLISAAFGSLVTLLLSNWREIGEWFAALFSAA